MLEIVKLCEVVLDSLSGLAAKGRESVFVCASIRVSVSWGREEDLSEVSKVLGSKINEYRLYFNLIVHLSHMSN